MSAKERVIDYNKAPINTNRCNARREEIAPRTLPTIADCEDEDIPTEGE